MSLITGLRACLTSFIFALPLLSSMTAYADGGISIQGTRVVYPMKSRQVSLTVQNSSLTDSFLVQSWVETEAGTKVADFIVTPPLYLSEPQNENVLRIIRTSGNLPKNRESLYYFVVKDIPSIEKKESKRSILNISAATRIKLFVRPDGLGMRPEDAPSKLNFTRKNNKLHISNPTPYYLTITDIKAGNVPLESVMVAPGTTDFIPFPTGSGSRVTYHTINDSGAITAPITVSF